VVIFLSSLEPKDEAIKKYVDTILEMNTKLKPFAVEVFGGRMRFLGKTSHDQRDINKAREWAQNMARQIKAESQS